MTDCLQLGLSKPEDSCNHVYNERSFHYMKCEYQPMLVVPGLPITRSICCPPNIYKTLHHPRASGDPAKVKTSQSSTSITYIDVKAALSHVNEQPMATVMPCVDSSEASEPETISTEMIFFHEGE